MYEQASEAMGRVGFRQSVERVHCEVSSLNVGR